MDVTRRILDLCNQRNISINKLAELADVTQSTLNSIINSADPNPQYKTLERICNGFNITMGEFFAEEKHERESEMHRFMEAASKLPPEQREQLQRLMETMWQSNSGYKY